MDTTSNVLSRILSLLATHPEVQDKLRREVMNALDENDGQDFSYDQLVSLPLLDAVCRETLRLYVHLLFAWYVSFMSSVVQLPTLVTTAPNVRLLYHSPATDIDSSLQFLGPEKKQSFPFCLLLQESMGTAYIKLSFLRTPISPYQSSIVTAIPSYGAQIRTNGNPSGGCRLFPTLS